jgi:hypothetical protein
MQLRRPRRRRKRPGGSLRGYLSNFVLVLAFRVFETRHDREWEPLLHPWLPNRGGSVDEVEAEEVVELFE